MEHHIKTGQLKQKKKLK